MGILSTLRKAAGGQSSTVWECRHCGETLAENAEECPTCGAEDIAYYEI